MLGKMFDQADRVSSTCNMETMSLLRNQHNDARILWRLGRLSR
jgi:hypothetical protein